MKRSTFKVFMMAIAAMLMMAFAGCGGDDGDDPMFKELAFNATTGVITVTFREDFTDAMKSFVVTQKINDGAEATLTPTFTKVADKATATITVVAKNEKEQKVTIKVTYDGTEKTTDYTVVAYTEDELKGLALNTEISALPAVAAVKVTDKAAVEAAKAKYDALGAAGKALVADAAKIDALLAEIAKIEANMAAAKAVDDKIGALGTITIDSKAAIDEAEAAYNALTADQKAYVTKKATLDAAKTAYATLKKDADDQVAADAVAAEIKKIEDLTEVTLANKDLVAATKAAYDKLTTEQKGKVAAEKVAILNAAVAKIAELEAIVAVEAKIDGIPAEVALTDETTVNAAKAAYDKLTADQKAKVAAEKVTKLDAAIAKISEIKAYNTLKAEIESKVAAYEAKANGDLSTKELVVAAKDAKAAITLGGLNATDLAAIETRIAAADAKVKAAEQALNPVSYVEVKQTKFEDIIAVQIFEFEVKFVKPTSKIELVGTALKAEQATIVTTGKDVITLSGVKVDPLKNTITIKVYEEGKVEAVEEKIVELVKKVAEKELTAEELNVAFTFVGENALGKSYKVAITTTKADMTKVDVVSDGYVLGTVTLTAKAGENNVIIPATAKTVLLKGYSGAVELGQRTVEVK